MIRPAVFKSTAVDGKMWTVIVEGVETHYRTRDEARRVAGLKPARKPLPVKVAEGLARAERTGDVTVIKVPGGTIEIG